MSSQGNSNTTNTGGPPPPTGQHRKSSSFNRGWFEGTMETITTMVPRPVTPSQQIQRPASAPNSPARGMGVSTSSSFGLSIPGISRLPSQDSLDRSIHNESGHGKSTVQIVRDLKHANAALTAKMASQEKQYMNQLAEVSSNQGELEDTVKRMRQKIAQYEAYKTSAESKMKERDAALSKVKEESAFQRHTISDLKNQMYQLQNELDEQGQYQQQQQHQRRQRGSEDDGEPQSIRQAVTASSSLTSNVDDLQSENEELYRQIQELQDQLMDYQSYDKKLQELQRQLEDAQRTSTVVSSSLGLPSNGTTGRSTPPGGERPPLAPSPSRDRDDQDYYRVQLQQTQGELEAHRQKLVQRESNVKALEIEKESLTVEHSKRVRELEARLSTVSDDWSRREDEIRTQLASHSKELELQLEGKDELVAELEERLEDYAERMTDLASRLAESRQSAQNQEQYRRDEAEDLRVVTDAQELEIAGLKRDLEDSQRELELRDEELEEVKLKLQEAEEEVALVRKRLQDEEEQHATPSSSSSTRNIGSSSKEDEKKVDEDLSTSSKLQEQLFQAIETVTGLERQLDEKQKQHAEAVAMMQTEKEALMIKIKELQDCQTDNDTEFTNIQNLWKSKSTAVQEVETLKKELESMKQRVHESIEAEKVAHDKAVSLELTVKELNETQKSSVIQSHTSQRSKEGKESDELQILTQELDLARKEAVNANDESIKLMRIIDQLELEKGNTEKVKRQLHDAQIALVAIDDEKVDMTRRQGELLDRVNIQREEIEREMAAQLQEKDAELVAMQKIASRVEALEAENNDLQKMVQKFNGGVSSKNKDVAVSHSIPVDFESVKKDLENQIYDLKEQKSLMQVKLKDRDTTISTLVRSAMILEQKIDALENEREESKLLHRNFETELTTLRKTVSSRKDDDSRFAEEIRYLKRELKLAKADAKRWKKALQEDGSTGSDYRFQISLLQKSNEDYAETIQERDQAIQTLVNQSMTQEAHVRDLKTRISALMKEVESVRMQKGRFDEGSLKAEVHRLQEESEIFAGQIIEQDEEFKRMQRVMRARDEQISALKKEIGVLKANVSASPVSRDIPDNLSLQGELTVAKAALQAREQQILEVQQQMQGLQNVGSSLSGDDANVLRSLRAELDEMQEAAESNRIELRDLRRQLWEAKEAAGCANDLRLELEQVKYTFDDYQRRNPQSMALADNASAKLNEALTRNAELAEILAEKPDLQMKIQALETELHEREILIEELRTQLSNAFRDNHLSSTEVDADTQLKSVDVVSLIEQIKMSEAEIEKISAELSIRTKTVEELNDQINELQSEVNMVRGHLHSKTNDVELLTEQIRTLQIEISDFHEQSNNHSREITDAFNENTLTLQSEITDAREELLRKSKIIISLEEQVKSAQTEIEEFRATLQLETEKVKELTSQAETSDRNIEMLSKDNNARIEEMNELERRLQEKESEYAVSSTIQLKLGTELADTQARLGALEKELTDAATASSSSDELSFKNQSLVQENASLAQKNGTLGRENIELSSRIESFAEQVQTLSDDNQVLCQELQSFTHQNAALEEAIASLKSENHSLSNEIESLKAQNDRLGGENSNLEQRVVSLGDDVDSLVKEVGGLSHVVQSLTSENKILGEENKALSEKLVSLTESIASVNEANDSLRQEVKDLAQEMRAVKEDNELFANENQTLNGKARSLENDIVSRSQEWEALSQEKESLRRENESLVQEKAFLAEAVEKLKDRNEVLTQKTQDMSSEIETLRSEIENASRGISGLEEHRSKLEQMNAAREAEEKFITDSYEKRLAALCSSKDAEIDELRMRLTESRGQSTDDMEEMMIQIKAMDYESRSLREHFELEMQSKDQQIFALEHTLHAQEQLVDSMRAEMDQLQSGMEQTTLSRRGEVEELQQEVMQVGARALKQEREIVALKMQLEESKLDHKAEVVRLKDALALALEEDSPLKQTISDLQNNDRMLEVRERLEQLKAKNTSLQEENLKLGGRLERAAIQLQSLEVEKQHADEIEEENGKLRKQLNEYEQLMSRSSQRAVAPPPSPKAASAPAVKENTTKTAEKKKKSKFGLFKRRNIDGPITEEKEEDLA